MINPVEAVLTVRGDVDLDTAPSLRTRLEALAQRTALKSIAVDLSSVDFLDSSGLEALVRGRDAARRRGIDLWVIDPSPVARKVIELTALVSVAAPATRRSAFERVRDPRILRRTCGPRARTRAPVSTHCDPVRHTQNATRAAGVGGSRPMD